MLSLIKTAKYHALHVIPLIAVPVSAMVFNVLVASKVDSSSDYARFIEFVQWSGFAAAALGLNLLELRSSKTVVGFDLEATNYFVLLLCLVVAFLATALWFLGHGTYAIIGWSISAICSFNAISVFLIYSNALRSLLALRLIRCFALFATAGFVWQANTVNVVEAVTLFVIGFATPVLLFLLRGGVLSTRLISVLSVVRMIRKNLSLVSLRLSSYLMDMTNAPILASCVAIYALSDGQKILPYFFGLGLPVFIIIRQVFCERFRMMLTSQDLTDFLKFSDTFVVFGASFSIIASLVLSFALQVTPPLVHLVQGDKIPLIALFIFFMASLTSAAASVTIHVHNRQAFEAVVTGVVSAILVGILLLVNMDLLPTKTALIASLLFASAKHVAHTFIGFSFMSGESGIK